MSGHLFVLPREIWTSVTKEEVISTIDAMTELNIDKPPYREFDIQTSATIYEIYTWLSTGSPNFVNKDKTHRLHESQRIAFKYHFDESLKKHNWALRLMIKNQPMYLYPGSPQFDHYCGYYEKQNPGYEGLITDQLNITQNAFLSVLLALLATKNAIKEQETIKMHGAKSRKKQRHYRYITTIKIGQITETVRSNGVSGSSVRPHLRRGHIRNQPFGVGRKETKQIFIQPMFVNADEGWIENQRKEYRIKV